MYFSFSLSFDSINVEETSKCFLFCYFQLENLLLDDLRSVWSFYIVLVIKGFKGFN